MNTGVYRIRNLQNGKVYIGSSKDIEERWRQHTLKLNRGTHPCRKLLNAWKKYGSSTFQFEIIELCSLAELLDREQHWIDTTMAYTTGYNSRPKAESCLGYKRGAPTEEHKRKNAEAHTGSKNSNWGKPRSEQTKAKIASAQKGKPRAKHSEATRALMSQNRKLRYSTGVTKEHRQQLIEARKKRVYHPHSEETKAKMRASHTARLAAQKKTTHCTS
jgi:group I intron endonuclease